MSVTGKAHWPMDATTNDRFWILFKDADGSRLFLDLPTFLRVGSRAVL